MAGDSWADEQRVDHFIERHQEIPGQGHQEIPGQEEVARVVLQDVIAGRNLSRILDLGTGDGRVMAGLRLAFPDTQVIGLDYSPLMLDRARERFGDDSAVRLIQHDLNEPLPENLGRFDLIISALAIHHLPDERKRALYREAFGIVEPGGVFCNIDMVALPTEALFRRAMVAVGVDPEEEDPTDQPTLVEPQLEWLREAGFVDVDCYWKWLAAAVLVGERSV